ncbi:DUF4214 domain-containing protein [Quadrisphaera sp. INWT6]|uniref:DUF4214 domain-containing protein n=1 Tax=Quadrisphaera sp. INWT6 TaxID=2596917 RepID=UPI001891FAE3|nr:hypothetical protein [Quadrisphaera sp. INWT6]MBF5082168.1 hypothetical protein [Quadrisphaera sp. INWT6]
MKMHRRTSTLLATLAALALSTAALASAPAASAAPGDRELVNRWYANFLGRLADPGSQYWVDRLTTQAPADVLWAITHSEEYDATTIDLYYRSQLNREPDRGARYWVDGINAQRFPAEWALQNILASAEYQAGRSSTTVINGYYETLLGRAPSAGEVSYWAGRLRTAGSLGTVREIYYSSEAVTRRITDTYDQLLDRAPSSGEVSYWYPKQVENSVNVDVLIASTPEYRTLSS